MTVKVKDPYEGEAEVIYLRRITEGDGTRTPVISKATGDNLEEKCMKKSRLSLASY